MDLNNFSDEFFLTARFTAVINAECASNEWSFIVFAMKKKQQLCVLFHFSVRKNYLHLNKFKHISHPHIIFPSYSSC